MKSIVLLFVFLLCNLFTTNLVAQTKLEGARSWQTVSSLLGKTIAETKTILLTHGLVSYETDENIFAHRSFNFYTEGKNPKYAHKYQAVVRNDTVIGLNIDYNYRDRFYENDYTELQKKLIENGYTLKEKKEGIWDKKGYLFKSDKNRDAIIIVSTMMELLIGDPGLVYIKVSESGFKE